MSSVYRFAPSAATNRKPPKLLHTDALTNANVERNLKSEMLAGVRRTANKR